ncbi:MAG: PLDc N-terminal domain-containing protein [Cyclobacteriaceae bacterium]|jgi:hypothetical protein|nr:PLDc N-terminal domain-containing protein [Cyclobacteriaceae bacterium]
MVALLGFGMPGTGEYAFLLIALAVALVSLVQVFQNSKLLFWEKMVWAVVILVIPIVGAAVYLVWGKNWRIVQ